MLEKNIKSHDGTILHTYIWDDVKNPVGVVQLVHGSCEHALRYDEFAKWCNANGYIVVGNDHRGHGKTAEGKTLGFFAEKHGWEKIVDDLKFVNSYILENYPNLKIIMIGHSMGSFMARHYIIEYGKSIDAVVLSGTSWYKKIVLKFGHRTASINQKRHGNDYQDTFVFNHSYKPLNKKFKKSGSTGSEWIQNSQENVAKFVADPLCGFLFTSAAYKDMFSGLMYIQDTNNIRKIRKDLPILIASGKQDSVGGFGKAVTKTVKNFQKNGLEPEFKLYPKSRHEILFDIEKEQVQNDLLEFMNAVPLQNRWKKSDN